VDRLDIPIPNLIKRNIGSEGYRPSLKKTKSERKIPLIAAGGVQQQNVTDLIQHQSMGTVSAALI
jgi:thiamine monophosphate synthase